jgi:tRNA-binding EMAP/Myf-like protein
MAWRKLQKSEPKCKCRLRITYDTIEMRPMQITYADFEKIDGRAGRVVQVEDFPRAQKPSYRVQVH